MWLSHLRGKWLPPKLSNPHQRAIVAAISDRGPWGSVDVVNRPATLPSVGQFVLHKFDVRHLAPSGSQIRDHATAYRSEPVCFHLFGRRSLLFCLIHVQPQNACLVASCRSCRDAFSSRTLVPIKRCERVLWGCQRVPRRMNESTIRGAGNERTSWKELFGGQSWAGSAITRLRQHYRTIARYFPQ